MLQDCLTGGQISGLHGGVPKLDLSQLIRQIVGLQRGAAFDFQLFIG